jgi:hypothetical protein
MTKYLFVTAFYFFITSCFCLAGENRLVLGQKVSLIPLPFLYLPSRGMLYHKKLNTYFSPWDSQNQFDSDNSCAGKSKTLHNPIWKQAGIYSLEFVGGEVGTLFNFFLNNEVWVHLTSFPPPLEGGIYNVSIWYGAYAISNTFVTGCSVLLVGKLLKQKSSWKKVAIGAGIGTLINGIAIFGSPPLAISSFSLPSLGAVIGFNL